MFLTFNILILRLLQSWNILKVKNRDQWIELTPCDVRHSVLTICIHGALTPQRGAGGMEPAEPKRAGATLKIFLLKISLKPLNQSFIYF